jgi:hypothetical protein
MVYRFVLLSDEDELFIREFEFLENQNLMDFHNLIQEELEFDKSQMASFFMATDNWEKEEEFTLLDMGTGSSIMEEAVFEDIIFRKNQKLLYVFDFFNDRSLFIEYIGETKEIEGREYPNCTNSKGLPPKQVVFGGPARKVFNNFVVTDDEEDVEADEIFFNGDEEEDLPDFENIDNIDNIDNIENSEEYPE